MVIHNIERQSILEFFKKLYYIGLFIDVKMKLKW